MRPRRNPIAVRVATCDVNDIVAAFEAEISLRIGVELNVIGQRNDVAAGDGFQKRRAALDGGKHFWPGPGGGAFDLQIFVPVGNIARGRIRGGKLVMADGVKFNERRGIGRRRIGHAIGRESIAGPRLIKQMRRQPPMSSSAHRRGKALDNQAWASSASFDK